jgi:pimeloyl-ACP methyl ester carboxylesterase
MKALTVDGVSVEYYEHGAGPPVVFVHGAPSDYRMWMPHCAALSDRYRAIAYTQRYFGNAAWDEGWPAFGTGLHADDLVGLVHALRAGPVHVVAWSYGGHVALTAAAREPEAFRSVLVYEPGVPTYVTDERELAAIADDGNAMFGPVFAAVQAGDMEAAVRVLLDGSGQRAGYFDSQPEERRRIQLDNARVLPRLLAQVAPVALSCEQLRKLDPPVSIAWGAFTRPFFRVVSEAAARCVGGNQHTAVAGATHMWPAEHPAEFVALVRRFIDAH